MGEETHTPAAGVGDAGSSSRRRRIIQALAAAGAAATVLPDRWLKPVVDSVVVPLHAQSMPGCVADFLTVGAEARWEEDGLGDTATGLARREHAV